MALEDPFLTRVITIDGVDYAHRIPTISADSGNLATIGSDGFIYVPPVFGANPLLIALPSTDLTVLGTWYQILPPTTFDIPERPGNTLLQIAISLNLLWTANTASTALADWSLDAGVTNLKRTFHGNTSKQDISSVNGVDAVFWQKVPGNTATVTIYGRQYSGPIGMSVLAPNTPQWPDIGSYALILDLGPIP